MRQLMIVLLCAAFGAPVFAADLRVSVEIPQLDVAEYHRPYVAIWIEREDQSVATDLAIWYDVLRDGTDWLADLRQWWRRSGRDQSHPIDVLSSASKRVGTHEIAFDASRPQLANLAPGEYRLVVEAAREVGGRELLRIPFTWPTRKPQKLETRGERELGAITLQLNP